MGARQIDDDHRSSSDNPNSITNQRLSDYEDESDSTVESAILSYDEIDLLSNEAGDNQIKESEKSILYEDVGGNNREITSSKTQLAMECRSLINPTEISQCKRPNNKVSLNKPTNTATTTDNQQFKGEFLKSKIELGLISFILPH